MNFTTYSQALDYIYSLTMTGTQRIFGHLGLHRTKYLLSLVGNPQDKLKIIHVAGTSGKGGTCYILSELLQKVAKKSVGLHVSPHLLDLRERMQIDGQLVDEQTFVDCLNTLTPAIQTVSESFFGHPTYYDVTIALTYLIFASKQVDFAIIEVGCGGLLDGSNVSDNAKYCIITKQGFDHMDIVGNTMTEITRNDAGIITPQSTVITLHHEEPICNDIIDYRCSTQHAQKIIFDPQTHVSNITYSTDKTLFEYHSPQFFHNFPTTFNHLSTTFQPLSTNLLGPFHLENLGLALTAFFTICEQENLPLSKGALKEVPLGWGRGDHNSSIEYSQLLTTLQSLHRKGRFDLMQYIPPVDNDIPPVKGDRGFIPLLLDGAHNPQKMQALLDTLDIIYSKPLSVQRSAFSFYVSFKQGKQRQEMLDIIIPHAKEIIIGDFMTVQDFKLHSVPAQEILDYLVQQGYNNAHINTDPLHVIEQYYETNLPLIITGSLYFLSCIYQKT